MVEKEGEELGIVHIYSEAPEYGWVHDADEGAACVDDAARAAVFYLRDVELKGDAASRRKAEALLRFVLYMQAENGLFHNFVWNSGLEINTKHPNSRADDLSFWTARGVWALGRCAEVFAGEDLGSRCGDAARRTLPHLAERLEAYGDTFEENGRRYPRWLLQETASDATSELLLGLLALARVDSSAELDASIGRLVEGIGMMQYGRIGEFPFGAHASWTETWHAWGNAQTQALAQLAPRGPTPMQAGSSDREADSTAPSRVHVSGRTGPVPSTGWNSAIHEADHFYPVLLVDGWVHSMDLADPAATRHYEQIAYGVRGVALGLLELYRATGEARYAAMAGLAASWFTGNNDAGAVMYDPETGRGYDGITGPETVNWNAGAESTIEALMTLLEIEHEPAALKWLFARGDAPREWTRNGRQYRSRIFQVDDDAARIGVILNLTDQESVLLEGEALAEFLAD